MADAERLLRRAIELSPAFIPAFADLASLLCRNGRANDAIALLDETLRDRPTSDWALSLKAAILEAEHRVEDALCVHEALIARVPSQPIPWLNYGEALSAIGRLPEAISAYRRSLALDPASGFAWRGLAGLRTVRLDAEDVAVIERALACATDDLSRAQLHFALAKALGDLGRFETSFRHYGQANAFRGRLAPYDRKAVEDIARRSQATFTAESLSRRAAQGCNAPDPIFIVGMPRSGSTLVEQILASHPMIEGAGELPALNEIALRIGGSAKDEACWTEAVSRLEPAELKALGESYLDATRRFRRTDRPFFTDKMPSNWQYLGLIHLILPEAKIIDVRRHPLACCFSAFTTYFNSRTRFPTSLDDLGRYYRSYVELADHFEDALPGRIHRLFYEMLVNDTEHEVRRLLAYLGVPFDEACLHFHENPRPVHTPSAQQVREPINRHGLERWRNYEPWLAPLKHALGQITVDDSEPAGLARTRRFPAQKSLSASPPGEGLSFQKGSS